MFVVVYVGPYFFKYIGKNLIKIHHKYLSFVFDKNDLQNLRLH